MLLDQIAANLVQNAVRYNVDGGVVEVRTGLLGERAIIEVGNSGAVVDEADAATLGEPFRRLETSRARTTGGYGLGLAVVRSVAQAHGGDVAIRPRAGGGLDVRVTLPATRRVAEPRGPLVSSGARLTAPPHARTADASIIMRRRMQSDPLPSPRAASARASSSCSPRASCSARSACSSARASATTRGPGSSGAASSRTWT